MFCRDLSYSFPYIYQPLSIFSKYSHNKVDFLFHKEEKNWLRQRTVMERGIKSHHKSVAKPGIEHNSLDFQSGTSSTETTKPLYNYVFFSKRACSWIEMDLGSKYWFAWNKSLVSQEKSPWSVFSAVKEKLILKIYYYWIWLSDYGFEKDDSQMEDQFSPEGYKIIF